MKKETLLFAVVILIVGVLIGVLVMRVTGRRSQESARPAGAPQAASAPMVNLDQHIRSLKDELAKDPQNRRAWVMLGDSYFDTKQFPEAVEAYDKALALDPNDANVLTDQGVMYRNLGWYDRALENFRKANQVDPSHLQSVYNMWVVYRQDLQDLDGAKKAIERYLEIAPNGPAAEQFRAELRAMEGMPQLPEGHPEIPAGQPLPGGQK